MHVVQPEPASASRTPPHNLESERAALGSVFIKPAALDDLTDLAVDDFFLPAHREVLEAMRLVDKRGRPVDVLTVGDEMKARGVLSHLDGGLAYLSDLSNATPTAENVRHYARIVRDKATLRRLIQACAEIQSCAYGDVGDVGELCSEARGKLAAIDSAGEEEPTSIGDSLMEVLDSMEHRADKPDGYFVRTGFRSFDEKFTGLRGGNLIVVAARPGKGKSAWALDILLNAADLGIPCLLFSFEMLKAELVERALAKRAQVDGRRVGNGRMSGPEWQRIHGAAGKLSDRPLYLYDKNLTAGRICAIARRWLAKHRVVADQQGRQKLALIAVDYIGLVRGTGDERTREREVAQMSAAFKQLASDSGVPVIAISQINRESEKTNREPRISDLRESGSIEQDANMIVFPHWDEETAAAARQPGDGIDAKLIIAKNRSGPTGFVWVDWVPEFVMFRDAPTDGPAQEQLL